MSMQALTQRRYGSFEVFQLETIDVPVPENNEVRISVRASGVNDWELGMMEGKPYIIRAFLGLSRPKPPVVGCEVAGVVDSVGSDVRKFKPGDKVYGDLSEGSFGSYAEYVCVPETAIHAMPINLTFEQAAAIPHAGLLMLQALGDIGGLEEGQSLLVNGAGGGVGALALQYAKLRGVRVTGVDSAAKADHMLSLGYNEVIDYEEEDFTESDSQYDLILDTKTKRSPFDLLRALKPGGTYVTVGGDFPRIVQIVLFGRWIALRHRKHVRMLSLKPNQGLDQLTGLVEAGELLPTIDRVYPLAEAVSAIERFASANHEGKVVISMGDGALS